MNPDQTLIGDLVSSCPDCAAGLDQLTSGRAFVGSTDLSTLDDRELTMLRRERIGLVFQTFNLVSTLTAEENISAVDLHHQSIVMVTHDPNAAAWADHVVFVVDGRVHEVMDDPSADSVLDVVKGLGR